ncbi:MAG: rod shape-determining protein MreC [Acidobacteriota bacterium]
MALLSSRPAVGGSPLERFVLAVSAPAAHFTGGLTRSVSGAGGSMRLARTLKIENESLRQRVDSMERELARLHGIEQELERLARLSGYSRAASDFNYVADVVFIDPESWMRSMVIHTGDEKARPDQVVINDGGLVGRIVTVAGGYAKVLLITDRAAAVSAMVKRTRRQGLVRGAGPGRLELGNLPLRSDVRVGDQVVTAGLDGVFPRGLPIGIVKSVEPGESLFLRIEVLPAVDFGLLDQVYVQPQQPLPEEVRSELIDEESGARP